MVGVTDRDVAKLVERLLDAVLGGLHTQFPAGTYV